MTQTCVMPDCRTHGRHRPGCADDDCRGCLPRLTDDGLICGWHLDRARTQLAAIAELAPDALAVARGEVRRGPGRGAGRPGSREPINAGAMDALGEIENTLTTWSRHVGETRGVSLP